MVKNQSGAGKKLAKSEKWVVGRGRRVVSSANENVFESRIVKTRVSHSEIKNVREKNRRAI
jgi:hypothetical protein